MVCKKDKGKKKGQAALEFLTTYGWAFMVILVMIGALAYFGVLNPSNLIPTQCAITSGFSCRDTMVTETYATLQLMQSMGSSIFVGNPNMTVGGVEVCDDYDFVDPDGTPIIYEGNSPESIGDGSLFFLNCTNLATEFEGGPGDKVKIEYSFTYRKSGGAFDQPISGTLTTTVQ